MTITPCSRTMVALDNMTNDQAFELLESMPRELEIVKIGMELFYQYGPDFVKKVHEDYGKRIFLDLKLHDIPNTVAKALGYLSQLPVEFITVHLSGGRQMLEACQQVRSQKMTHVNILGVSYLTSLDQANFKETWSMTEKDVPEAFERLFLLARTTNTQGVVCSPQELRLLKKTQESHEKKLLSVCPGIRFQDEIDSGSLGDQKRVLSPEEAFKEGADYLVIGRSLTQAKNIMERVKQISLVNL